MQIASSFDGNGSPLGTMRVIGTPVSEESERMRNSSHIQELYHNLPQLQKAIYFPVSYKAYENQYTLPNPYSEAQESTNSPKWYAKPPAYNQKPHYTKHHHQQVLDKREGWGWGGGGGSGGGGDAGHHHHHHGNTAALSALALLSFMFFLRLIEESLKNNREMLAAAANATTTAAVLAGRANTNLDGYHYRARRNIHEDETKTKTHTFSEYHLYDKEMDHTNYNTSQLDNNHLREKFTSAASSKDNNFFSSLTDNQKLGRNPVFTKFKSNPIEILRSSSVHCCQLLACKIGKSIYDSLDSTTGFMVRMMGSSMIPRVSKKTWTGRLLRAFDTGWKKGSCDSLYKNCGLLYNLFYKATNLTQPRRKAKKIKRQ